MKLIDGKSTAAVIKAEIAEEVRSIVSSGGKQPHLAVIIVGEDGASATYVNAKIKACELVGFKSTDIRLPENVSEEDLLKEINALNSNDDVDGFIVQLPLPAHISEENIIESIDPKKDVDGFHPINVGRMALGMKSFVSATPAGILELISRHDIDIEGKHCVVLGRSNIVGTPVSILLSRKAKPGNATVTICHSRTKNIAEVCKSADVLIVAIGQKEFVTADMVKVGAVVIDVGMHREKSEITKSGWKLKGDVKFSEVSEKASFITPVPGGVGPMTIISLLKNTLLAAKKEVYK